jgi:hypothetical protein
MQRMFQKIKNITITVSIYIYSLLLYVINNRQHFKLNSDNINTRNNLDFHYTQARLSVYQRGAYYTGIGLFNKLPGSIRQLSHDRKQFKTTLKGFFYVHSFYSMDEYFSYKMD